MNNKKLIRLTESDLHRIIKESVNKVLNEMDSTQYNQAMQQHPNLMNKVDPRTYANRARGVNAQGRKRNDNEYAMKSAAADAWNREFGKKESNPNGFWTDTPYGKMGGYNNDYYRMTPPMSDGNHNYKTERWQSMNFPGANDVHAHETYTTYDPKTNQTTSLRYDDMDGETVGSPGYIYYNSPGFGGYEGKYPTQRKVEDDWHTQGDKVAQQMSNGTGWYRKGKGWV